MNIRDLLTLLILAAVWGGSFLFMRVAGPVLGPFVTVELRVGIASVALLLTLSDFPREVPSLAIIFSILGLAILSTAFAYLLYFRLLNNIGPVKTLSVTFLVPIFGILWGYLFLQESVYVTTYVGMGIIFVGIMFVTNSWPSFSRKQKIRIADHEIITNRNKAEVKIL